MHQLFHFSNDKEEDAHGFAKIKTSENLGMGKFAKMLTG